MVNISEVIKNSGAKNINDVSFQTQELINAYARNNNSLLIAIIVLCVLIVSIVVIYFVFFHNKRRYTILIHMPSGNTERYKKRNITNMVKITHKNKLSSGEKDIFPYMVTNESIKSDVLQYFYRNPDPIIFNTKDFKITTEKMNIDQVLESDVIQKWILAKDLVNTMKILLIIILVAVVIIIFAEYMIYNKTFVCNLAQNITG